MVSESQDQLLLALAHGPLSAKLVTALVERTAEQSRLIGKDMSSEQQTQTKTPTQRLLLTGSTRVVRPGRELKDWETLWTAGEYVMNEVVERVGLEKFHLVGTNVRLRANLIDISQQNQKQEEKENGHGDNEDWQSTLKDDLTMVATRVASHLRIKRAANLSKATVIVPVEDKYAKMDRSTLTSLIEDVLNDTWANGPLQDADVCVELVY